MSYFEWARLRASKRRFLNGAAWPFLFATVVFSLFAGDRAVADDELDFETHVAPILQLRCGKCHGDEKLEAGFDVRRKFTIVAGGDSGSALVDGKPDESLLWQRIGKKEMPPPDEGQLDEAQKSVLRRWIEAGAKTRQSPERPLEEKDIPSRITAEDRNFWSFQSPQRRPLPAVRDGARARSPADVWLLARLESKQLGFNPDAGRREQLRRLTFDLWGLPPTWEQWETFRDDQGPDAYERLVDRLLASPRYGERWGRHWLDIAGYADSDGYLAADRLRPEAWRYRDYVIDAHNQDLPYDQFLQEQLAGDELSDWRSVDMPPAADAPANAGAAMSDELSAESRRRLIATGFLRTASDPTYPGYTEPNEIHQVLSDTLQIVGSTCLGLTVQCARCHAHKFDPFSQRDYYSLQAVFLPALDPARWTPSEVRGMPLATERRAAQIRTRNQQLDQSVAEHKKQLEEATQQYRQRQIAETLEQLGQTVHDTFDAPQLDARWSIVNAGTASGFQARGEGGEFAITTIQGKPGYAMVRFVRPVLLSGDFASKLAFRWHSQDDQPAHNKAMQAVLLQARDAVGNIVASVGFIDENNAARGSPITGVSGEAEPVGPDLVAFYMKKHGQAVPPSERARSAAPAGRATVSLMRDAAGQLTAHYDDGTLRESVALPQRAIITSVEVELRRYVLEPGATFEGLWLDEFQLQPGATSQVDDATRKRLAEALAIAPEKRNDEQKKLVASSAPQLAFTEAQLAERYPEFREIVARKQAAIKADMAQKQALPLVRGLADLDGPAPPGRILRRGDPQKPGAVVEAGVPEVLVPTGFHLSPATTPKSSGRRLAFARWLTQPDHPLTARVAVNRVWQHHFGQPLVATPANFGRSGAKPTHPELLDWLATELPARAWSVKSLHRQLVTSTVFRQSAAMTDEQRRLDPNNSAYGAWSPRRHEGEVVRDSVLAVSGKLQLQTSGAPAPVHPQADGSVITADDAQGNRRSIYLIVRRSQHLTMLDLFDTPLMEVNCPERNSSIVPLQALALLHGPFTEQNARAFGDWIQASATTNEGRIDEALRRVLTREPTDVERRRLSQFVQALVDESLSGAVAPTDAQRMAAEQAAWRQLALVLLNESEFLYVD